MPSFTTLPIKGILISTYLSLFGIVQANAVKTCVCTTTLTTKQLSSPTSSSLPSGKVSTSFPPLSPETLTPLPTTMSTESTTLSSATSMMQTTPLITSSKKSTNHSTNSGATSLTSNIPSTMSSASSTASAGTSIDRSVTSSISSATSNIPSISPSTTTTTSSFTSNSTSTASSTASNTKSTASSIIMTAMSAIISNMNTTATSTAPIITSATDFSTSATKSTTPPSASTSTMTIPSTTPNTITTTPTTTWNTGTKVHSTSSNPSTTAPTTATNMSTITYSNTSSTVLSSDRSVDRKRRADLERSSVSTYGYSSGFLGPDGICICSSTSEQVFSTAPNTETAKVLSLDTVPVKVPLVVSINKKFSRELLDKSSMLYKKYKSEFKSKLENTYKSMDNFVRVDILGFRNGSTVCDYAVVLRPGSVVYNTSIQKKTDTLTNVKIFNETLRPQNVSIVEVFQELYRNDSCISVDCGYGYRCTSATSTFVTCEHMCSSWNMCKNDGLCLLDDRHELPFCRCKTDDYYTYSGDYCEVKNEKFALSKTYIIAIAAGSGGGLLTILVVILIVLALKRKSNGNNKQRDDSVSHMKPVSMDDLRLGRMNDSRSSYEFLHRPRIHASENQYESGVPDTKYVQNREHRVMKDSRGEETYIYQPSSYIHPVSRTRDGSAYSNHIAGPSVYDYMDTESKFEIQRPNIRLGNMNKY